MRSSYKPNRMTRAERSARNKAAHAAKRSGRFASSAKTRGGAATGRYRLSGDVEQATLSGGGLAVRGVHASDIGPYLERSMRQKGYDRAIVTYDTPDGQIIFATHTLGSKFRHKDLSFVPNRSRRRSRR